MDPTTYNCVTGQFKRLLEKRGLDTDLCYFMNNFSKTTINVCERNSVLFTINISNFSREDIITSSPVWNIYKTDLLNKNLDNPDLDKTTLKQVTPFPIDVVYTWAGEAVNLGDNRVTNNNELKFSLQ